LGQDSDNSSDSLLQCTDIVSGYLDAPIIKGVSLSVKRGEIVAILGPNGSGKSTLLKSIIGLVKLYSGEILFQNKKVDGLATDQLVNMGIATCLQGRRTFPRLTVEENLRMGAYTISKEEFQKKQSEVYSMFPFLHEKRKIFGGNLSGGEQEMLSFGRAMLTNPKLLLVDEPSIGLSPKFVSAIYDKLKQVNDLGIAILLVEQNVRKALEVADRVYVLDMGRKKFEGTPEDLNTKADLAEMYLGIKSH
jgi:branched-chain amino acid transport system ATP-binding protein